MEADGAPETKDGCKNQRSTNYRGRRQKWEVSYQPQRQNREVYQPQGYRVGNQTSTSSLTTRWALNQSRGRSAINQGGKGGNPPKKSPQTTKPNQYFYRQGFSRGWGKGRRAVLLTARGCDNHGGRGGTPLTPNPTKPVQGMEVDGAPDSTKSSRVSSSACKDHNQGVEGGNPPQKPKSFLIAGLSRSLW